MKKILLYSLVLLSCSKAMSQRRDPFENPRIHALYVAYISQQLRFTPEEAQRFWPIHDQFHTEMQAINNSPLSDLDKEQEIVNLKRKYQPRIAGVIGNERGAAFYREHDQFREKLFNRFKEMKEERKAEKADGMIRQGGEGFRRGGGMGSRRENMIPPKSN